MERTIDEVFDVKNNVILHSCDFFKKSEHELMHWRRALEEAVLIGEPLLICPYCKQMLKLCGRKDIRGVVSYFSHLYDSDECDIKSTSHLSKDAILAHKYGGVCESNRHRNLKYLIADALSLERSQEIGVSSVEIEKRIQSQIPYLNWRRPDIHAQYKDMNLIFELQLSTTFLSVVVDRDIFYRLNGYYIIWVFNFDDNQEYVNLHNMMCKDIYYANKRNIFIFNERAQELSREKRELILCCQWLDTNGKFTKEEYVSLEQLSFDSETFKPYYVDADELYYDSNPHIKENIDYLEKSRAEILQSLMERQKRELELLEAECIRLEKFKKWINEHQEKAEIYERDGKYGFIYDGQILSKAIYSSIEWNHDLQKFNITKARRKGLANRAGEISIPCTCSKIEQLDNDLYLIVEKNNWRIWKSTSTLKKVSTTDSYSFDKLKYNFSLILFTFKERGGWHESKKTFLIFPNHHTLEIDKIDKINDTVEIKNEIYSIHKDGYIYRNIINDINLVIAGVKLIGISKSGKVVIPPVYHKLNYFSDKCIFAQKDGYTGIITIDNQTIVPIEFNDIVRDGYGYYRTRTMIQPVYGWEYYVYGLFTMDGKKIISAKYQEITPITSEFFVVKNQGKYGVLDHTERQIVPAEFDEIQLDGNKFVCKRQTCNSSYYALYSEDGQILIPLDWKVISINLRADTFIELTTEAAGYGNDRYRKSWLTPEYTLLLPLDTEVSEIALFNNGVAECRISRRYAKVDVSGNVFDIIENTPETIIKLCINGYYGLANSQSQELSPCKYHSLECMPNGIYIGDGHDIISDDARLLASHDGNITYLNEELFILDSNQGSTLNRYYLCNLSGAIISNGHSAIYEKSGYIHSESIENFGTSHKKWHGLYDLHGKRILQCVYDNIHFESDHIVIGKNANYDIIIDPKAGKRLKAYHIDKIADIDGMSYFRSRDNDGMTLIDSAFTIYDTYRHISYNNEEKRIEGIAKDWKLYNILTGEVLLDKQDIIEKNRYKGLVTGVQPYGVFVKLIGNYSGMIHKTALEKYSLTTNDFATGQEVTVSVIRIREDNKLNLDLFLQ